MKKVRLGALSAAMIDAAFRVPIEFTPRAKLKDFLAMEKGVVHSGGETVFGPSEKPGFTDPDIA